MILGDVISEDDQMTPDFLLLGARVNVVVYINVQKPWITEITRGRLYDFQQLRHPIHFIQHNNWWVKTFMTMSSTTSPVLTRPTSYCVCGVVMKDSNRHPNNRVAVINATVYIQWYTFPTHMINTCSWFWQCIKTIIVADGGLSDEWHLSF